MEVKNQKLNSDKRRMLMLADGNFDHASTRIRAIQYIPMFQNSGFNVNFIPRTGKKPSNWLFKYTLFPLIKRYLLLKRFVALNFRQWDLIFIQRSFVKESVLMRLKKKTPVIYDFDDAIYLSEMNSSAGKKTEIMIRYADKIIISTEYLNDFCTSFNKKGIIIPSPVETDRIKPENKPSRDILTIGWIGSSWTTEYLKLVEPSLQKLANENQFNFLTVGAKPDFTINNINHISLPWSYEYENSFVNQIDIGIMPLPANDFTVAKGGYKLYLYMAGGIPSVASPVGVNRSIIRDGENGFLASNENEWVVALGRLLRDEPLRKKMGLAGRNDAIEFYDREVCYEKLLGIVNSLT